MNFKKKLLIKTIGVTLLSCASTVQAANWLMLQGTEPEGQAARAKVWGFVQVQYQQDYSDPSNAPNPDGYIPPKLIGPNLDTQSAFNVNRARIGVRGTGLPLDSKVNYFILAEFGNNGITAPGGYTAALTDASITLNHIPGARIRAGMFKYPGAEEGLQAIHVFDYINFTSVTNQMLLERFPQDPPDANSAPQPTPDANMAQYSRSVGAFRDVGVQVFDTFKVSDWEHSYAVMYGNGNGLNAGDNDDNKDMYLYWSSEMIFGGKGGRREGLKMFAWYQDGKRTDAYDKTQEQDRTRQGLGAKYLDKPFRVTAEYMQGKGMIFQGQHRPQDIYNNEEADGGYIEGGWYIGNTDFEIDLRYDTYTRGENHGSSAADDESTADTWTIGGQYHFNKKTRVNLEYADRNYESQTANVDAQQTGVGGRFAIQLTHIF
jgi:hypothetical protein